MLKTLTLVRSGVLLALSLAATAAYAQEVKTYFHPSGERIPVGSKIYISPIPGGFENYIAAGILKKKVPVVIVNDRTKADYEISGVSESEKANWAKMLFVGSQASNEQASIQVVDLIDLCVNNATIQRKKGGRSDWRTQPRSCFDDARVRSIERTRSSMRSSRSLGQPLARSCLAKCQTPSSGFSSGA